MEIDMTRHGGATGLLVAEQIDRRGVWRVRTDFQPDVDQETGEQRGVTFIETEFPYKPTLREVRDFVLGVIDEQTRAAIISGFTYEGNPVWLSEENQLNFSQAVVPATLKIGEQQDGTPIYKTFSDAAELKAFNDACSLWRQQCLSEGYQKKDEMDWQPYEALYPVTEK